MILLVLVVLLWVAVLAPSAWRRFGERQGVGSIDHFHHQLQLLEHAGPKTVSPAYRLHTAMPGDKSTDSSMDLVLDSSRPKLVLLRPTDDAAAADVDGDDGSHYERVGVLDRPEPACLPEMSGGADPPSVVNRRGGAAPCLLRCLAGVAIATGLIGLFPGMQLALVVTGIVGPGSARRWSGSWPTPRNSRPSRPAAAPDADVNAAAPPVEDLATVGYPGAWDDDDFEVPRAAAR